MPGKQEFVLKVRIPIAPMVDIARVPSRITCIPNNSSRAETRFVEIAFN